MLTPTLITRYGIATTHDVPMTYDRITTIDKLFSGGDGDPVNEAANLAYDLAEGAYWDITVAICGEGKCVTQIIVFRDKLGFERYKRDQVTLFDQKEL